jgi:hypothetical protein
MNKKERDEIDAMFPMVNTINTININFLSEQTAAVILSPAQQLAREFMILKEQDSSEFELAAWRKKVKERSGSPFPARALLIITARQINCKYWRPVTARY